MKKVTMFKNDKGKRVPSVTTIVGQLDKPGLMYWAHDLGLKGVSDLRAHRDAISQAGKLAHELALPFLSGVEIGETLKSIQGEYEPEELELTVPIMNRFTEWAGKHTFRTIYEEESFISERYQFGGRIDWFGEMDGIPLSWTSSSPRRCIRRPRTSWPPISAFWWRRVSTPKG